MDIKNTYELGDIVKVKVDQKNGYPLKDNKNVTIHKGRIFGINISYIGISYNILIKGNFYTHCEIIGLVEKTIPTKIFENEVHSLSYFGLAKIQKKKTKEIFDISGLGEKELDIINIETKKIEQLTIKELLKNFEYVFNVDKEILSS